MAEVVFDLLGVQNRDHGERGIARYVLQLALAVERAAPGLVDRYLVRPHLPVPGGLEPLISTGRVRPWRGREEVDVAGGGVFVSGSLFELHEDADAVHPRPFRDPAWRSGAVLYDLIPLRFPELYLKPEGMRFPYLGRVEVARSMDHLLAISQATADDAARFLGHGPDRVTVIGAGADERFAPHPGGRAAAVADLAARPPVPGIRPGYVMNQGGIEPRKNLDRLLVAYAGLPADLRAAHQLVLVCKTTPGEAAELAARAAELGIGDDLLVTGYVGDDDLVRLYRAAEVVVFPSLYEGFGLPVLEAMQCGAPSICSDSSSLREVQTDPAARFDPTDPDAIRDAVARVLTDEAERERIRSLDPPDFTWDRAGEGTVAAIRALATGRGGAPVQLRPRRPRVALVTPMAPQRSGIATYAARMVEHLRRHVELTVFVDDPTDPVDPIPGVPVHGVSSFDAVDAGGRPFDRVVTFLGNSSFHVEALDLVHRVGGTVLLHDARLTGLYSEVQRRHPHRLVHGHVGATLASLYPYRYRAAIEDQWIIPPDLAALSGVHLLAGVVADADRVLVHSRYAADLCELDTGTRPAVPFAIPCVPPGPPVDGTPPAAEPGNHRIVSVGIVSPVKCPEVLVEAMPAVRDAHPGATLAFVGGGPDDYVAHLRGRISALGLDDVVTLTGHVDDAGFGEALAGAACTVQLRAFTNGESSAAVMDALSAGTPTVVTDLGAMGELDDEVVAKVPAGAGPAAVADVVVDLLGDPDRRRRMHEAGRAHAASHGFDVAALALLEAIGLTP